MGELATFNIYQELPISSRGYLYNSIFRGVESYNELVVGVLSLLFIASFIHNLIES